MPYLPLCALVCSCEGDGGTLYSVGYLGSLERLRRGDGRGLESIYS